ncbi:hypothetical protein ABW20_dc0106261 [Dactylellina cionopaga]|nr:hypothetical protein ABW20_dc0106261 [Dactylellina cionopaga]
MVGVREIASEGRSRDYERSTGSARGISKSNRNHSASRHSKTKSGGRRSDYGREEDDEDVGRNQPNYIPSSHSRGKTKASSGSDFACWFFKLDPVKYADCMHVHGRSSDLKYAHLKNHFRSGGVPPEFDKNMSWDEVWATLFPQTLPPNNKYYVINEIIMSILESASTAGDDVTRFLDALENPMSRETVTNRIYSISRDRGNSPGTSSSSNRKGRQALHLQSFDKIPRAVTDRSYITTPPSSSSGSGNSTPAISSRLASRYPPPASYYPQPEHDLDITIGDAHTSIPASYDPFHPALTTSSLLSPTSPHTTNVPKVYIIDEQCNELWFARELPWPTLVDFGTHFLSHECTKTGTEESVHIGSFEELQAEYEWHQVGEVGGNCHFTLFSMPRWA